MPSLSGYTWSAVTSDGKQINEIADDGHRNTVTALGQLDNFTLVPTSPSLPPIVLGLDDKRKLVFFRTRRGNLDDLAAGRAHKEMEVTTIGWREEVDGGTEFLIHIFPNGFVQIGESEPNPEFINRFWKLHNK